MSHEHVISFEERHNHSKWMTPLEEAMVGGSIFEPVNPFIVFGAGEMPVDEINRLREENRLTGILSFLERVNPGIGARLRIKGLRASVGLPLLDPKTMEIEPKFALAALDDDGELREFPEDLRPEEPLFAIVGGKRIDFDIEYEKIK